MSVKKQNRKKGTLSVKVLLKSGLVLCVCIYVTYVFVNQQISLSKCDDIEKEYKEKILEAQRETQRLEDELEQTGTDEYIQRMAREKLDYVKPNERVFVDISQE